MLTNLFFASEEIGEETGRQKLETLQEVIVEEKMKRRQFFSRCFLCLHLNLVLIVSCCCCSWTLVSAQGSCFGSFLLLFCCLFQKSSLREKKILRSRKKQTKGVTTLLEITWLFVYEMSLRQRNQRKKRKEKQVKQEKREWQLLLIYSHQLKE